MNLSGFEPTGGMAWLDYYTKVGRFRPLGYLPGQKTERSTFPSRNLRWSKLRLVVRLGFSFVEPHLLLTDFVYWITLNKSQVFVKLSNMINLKGKKSFFASRHIGLFLEKAHIVHSCRCCDKREV